jgi:chromatin licensing and DNA replication factor 1
MKYILPEGIEIEKVVVVEKKSLCMKPDLKITLVFEVLEDHSEQSAYLALGRYFNSRLINFFNQHPEVTFIFWGVALVNKFYVFKGAICIVDNKKVLLFKI